VIEEILPPLAACAEAFGDDADSMLFPEEEAVVAKAVDKRRREFTTARACARAALAQLGVPPVALLPGERGAPQWPEGIVGSITHCSGYRAAVVARSGALASVGIDAEPNAPLPKGVLPAVSLAAERDMLAGLAAGHPGVSWDRLLFSAKESVYKAWFPLTRRWLGFEDAELSIDPLAGTFTARILLEDSQVRGFSGRLLARDGLVVTAIAVQGPDSACAVPGQSQAAG
jgi:4'-phosphopantetheinyl transferase EntD